jgi:hypothetical protein
MQIFPVAGSGSSNGGTQNLYYNPNPNQSFANPSTFSQGQLIATLSSPKWMASVSPSGGVVAGTYALVSSSDFTIQGTTYNVNGLGSAVTFVLSFGPLPTGASPYGPVTIPFGGYGLQTSVQVQKVEVRR